MNSATAFRFLLLVIPVVWVVIPLLPAEPPRYGNLKAIASHEYQSQQAGQGMTGQDNETFDKFANYQSSCKAQYRSHYTTSGYDHNHDRLAYKYEVDLALDPHHQKMDWNSIEPHARQNCEAGIIELWSQHRQAILYGWEQGGKLNSG